MNGSSTSVKNILHFGQLIRTKKMAEFDPEHGLEHILDDDDQEVSPKKPKEHLYPEEIDVANIANVKLVMIAGLDDSLCTAEDTKLLYKKIKEKTEIPITLTYLKGLGHKELIRGEDMSHF